MIYQNFETSTKIILKVVFVLLALGFLWIIRDIILIFLFAVVVASAMDPLADRLKQRKVPRVVSVLTVYILVLGAAGLVVYLLVPPVMEQMRLLFANLPEYSKQLQHRFPVLAGMDISSVVQQLFSVGQENNSVVGRTVGLFSGFFSFLTILVISFYLVAEEKGMKNFIRSLVPLKHRDVTMLLVDRIQQKMGLWVLGQFLLSLAIFVFTFIGLTLLGVRYALFLALLAGLLEVVPFIGPTLSAIPAVFFAFVQNPALALAVIVLYLLVQKMESLFLVPKIMQKTVGTSPLVVLLALLIGFKLAGIIGILLAVPLVSAVTVVLTEFQPVGKQEESEVV